MSVDAKDELLRDIERELEKASHLSQTGVNGNYRDGFRQATPARSEEAVNVLLRLISRAKVTGGVRW